MKKLLIVQFRTNASEKHEQDIFLEDYAAVADRIEFLNFVHQPFPEDLSSYAGVVLGGSGEFMFTELEDHPIKQKIFRFLDILVEADVPVLGICFGFQMLALHQGAKIVSDPALQEVGMFKTQLTGAGEYDPLFANVPFSFMATLGHKETILQPPAHLIRLASSDRVPFSAFRMKDTNVWGVLAHPELNESRIIDRMKLSPNYAENGGMEACLNTLAPVPHIPKILQNFLAQCRFGDNATIDVQKMVKDLELNI